MCIFEVELETGRTHQIRIHGSENGCPILGDTLYAPIGVCRMLDRLALHSHHLSFVHFDTGIPLSFTAPLADDLALFWRQFLHETLEDKKKKDRPSAKSRVGSNFKKKKIKKTKSRKRH